MKKPFIAALAAFALVAVPLASYGAGMFSLLPVVGGPSYCAAIVGASNAQAGTTGQGAGTVGTNGTYCAQTVPAGPATFSGNEVIPVDLQAPGSVNGVSPTTGLLTITQLGQGPLVDVTSPATATIPANTLFYVLDGAQGSAFTITMPAAPIEGQRQIVVCELATTGALTIAANTGQTIKFNPNTACVAGTPYAYRYVAASATWFKV